MTYTRPQRWQRLRRCGPSSGCGGLRFLDDLADVAGALSLAGSGEELVKLGVTETVTYRGALLSGAQIGCGRVKDPLPFGVSGGEEKNGTLVVACLSGNRRESFEGKRYRVIRLV